MRKCGILTWKAYVITWKDVVISGVSCACNFLCIILPSCLDGTQVSCGWSIWWRQPDHQWEFGEMDSIRSCSLLNQIGLCIPKRAFTGIVQSLTRVRLPLSLCGGAERAAVMPLSSHSDGIWGKTRVFSLWTCWFCLCCFSSLENCALHTMINVQNEGHNTAHQTYRRLL